MKKNLFLKIFLCVVVLFSSTTSAMKSKSGRGKGSKKDVSYFLVIGWCQMKQCWVEYVYNCLKCIQQDNPKLFSCFVKACMDESEPIDDFVEYLHTYNLAGDDRKISSMVSNVVNVLVEVPNLKLPKKWKIHDLNELMKWGKIRIKTTR